MASMWGIHNDTLTTDLIEGSFVSIGYDKLNFDLRSAAGSRESLKAALDAAMPGSKMRAIASWAGVLDRFVNQIEIGDIVVAPYKPDGTINVGIVTGSYYFFADAPTHRHRRAVEWRKLGVSRTVFTQPALYEVGAFLTVFAVTKYAAEFQAVLHAPGDSVEVVELAVEHIAPATTPETVDEPRVSRVERHTRDFVLNQLKRDLSPQEFESFTADLLRAMGYQARVTAYSQDGGVDVIAHRDPLGIEPPLIKVQCKQMTASIGSPEVQQLLGTLAQDELGLFVTLGSFTREARGIERQNRRLRLLGGEDLVELFLGHYAGLAAPWRLRIPLALVLVVDDVVDR